MLSLTVGLLFLTIYTWMAVDTWRSAWDYRDWQMAVIGGGWMGIGVFAFVFFAWLVAYH